MNFIIIIISIFPFVPLRFSHEKNDVILAYRVAVTTAYPIT